MGAGGLQMEHRTLGVSGLTVPVIGMGTSKTFDVRDPDKEAHACHVVAEALTHGVTFFDSSPMYGEAERVLGAALEGVRARALVATKIWTPSNEEGRRQADTALRLFGHVDLYQLH